MSEGEQQRRTWRNCRTRIAVLMGAGRAEVRIGQEVPDEDGIAKMIATLEWQFSVRVRRKASESLQRWKDRVKERPEAWVASKTQMRCPMVNVAKEAAN